jgi:hypothetical protein
MNREHEKSKPERAPIYWMHEAIIYSPKSFKTIRNKGFYCEIFG